MNDEAIAAIVEAARKFGLDIKSTYGHVIVFGGAPPTRLLNDAAHAIHRAAVSHGLRITGETMDGIDHVTFTFEAFPGGNRVPSLTTEPTTGRGTEW